MIEALCFRRFEWPDTPPHVGDIERILTLTGVSAPVTVDGQRTIRPVYTPICTQNPYKPVTVTIDDKSYTLLWSDLIQVAPAKLYYMELKSTIAQLSCTLQSNIVSSRTTKYIKSVDPTKPEIQAISTGQTKAIPILPVSSSLNSDDILTVGDGDIRAQGIREAWNVALGMYSQLMGVHTTDTVKKERLITDEAETMYNPTDLCRENEIRQRQKVAEWLGIQFKTNI